MRLLVACALFVAISASPRAFFMKQLAKKAHARHDGMHHRVEDLRENVAHLREEFDDRLEKGREALALVHDVEARVHRIQGDGCSEHELNCNDHGHTCLNELLVCDHSSDCPNGHDEDDAVCENLVTTGTVLEGDVDHSECMADHHEDHLRITITGERRLNWFSSVILVHAHIKGHNTDGTTFDHEMDGQYYFARKMLTLQPSADMENRLGVICRFYGRLNDRCHLSVVHEATLDSCMEAEMTVHH